MHQVSASRRTTEQLILHFFTYVAMARARRIARYLGSQWGIPTATTYSALINMEKRGQVERVMTGVYTVPIGAEPVALEQYRLGWATGTKDADTLMHSISEDRRMP